MADYTSDNISVLDSEAYLQLRLFSVFKPDLIYVIIGYLQEYFGGYELSDKRVDMFFVNESEKAKLFKRICEKLLEQKGILNDVELNVSETGHSAVFSESICSILKEFYTNRIPDFLNHECYTLSTTDKLFVEADQVELTDNAKLWNFYQLSFLMGIFMRNRTSEDDKLSFANASHKLEATVSFLQNFCVSGDTFNVDYHFNVPHATIIRYNEGGGFFKGFFKMIDEFNQSL